MSSHSEKAAILKNSKCNIFGQFRPSGTLRRSLGILNSINTDESSNQAWHATNGSVIGQCDGLTRWHPWVQRRLFTGVNLFPVQVIVSPLGVSTRREGLLEVTISCNKRTDIYIISVFPITMPGNEWTHLLRALLLFIMQNAKQHERLNRDGEGFEPYAPLNIHYHH